jgi:hypothetical protein
MPLSDTPRWEKLDWLILLGYLALAHIVFYPIFQIGHLSAAHQIPYLALRTDVFLYGRDTVAHDYSLLLYNWSQIVRDGRLGLWNPYLFCGLPSLGTFASCPFYPTTWLFAVLPTAPAFNYQYILNCWLAGLWTYWAARWMGLRRPAAFFAGLVFMVSGHFVTLTHAGHLQKFAAIAWLPLAFAGATAAMKERRWGGWIVCGVALAAQLLASHLQIAYYTILFLVPWIFWLAIKRVGQVENPPFSQANSPRHISILFGVGGLALALLVAGGLSAAQMLPAIETMPLTNRGTEINFKEVTETSYPPFEFGEYVLPSFLGDNAFGSKGYWGEWGERIVTDYMGLLPIVLLVFALVVSRDRDRWFHRDRRRFSSHRRAATSSRAMQCANS